MCDRRLVRSALFVSVFAAVFAFAAACGSSSALMSSPDLAMGGGGGDGGNPSGADMTALGCNGGPRPLDETWTVPWMGVDRTLNVHTPASYDGHTPVALVFNFHGFTSNADQEALLSLMNAKSDAAGFVVIYPNGVANSWNAGACCGMAAQTEVDDVGFVSNLIDVADAQLCIDKKRVFATGMSNGGFLSHRLACELSSRIAAVAPVAGVLGITTCTPSRHVPIMGFHGTADTLVPYTGSASLGFPAVPATYDAWATRDGCMTSSTETFNMGDSHCSTYMGCPAGVDVILCTVEGGGHTWPGGTPVPTLGKTTTDLNATDSMWDFFTKHPMQ
jgi:polyhydroxybutyrate depolymerase